MPLPRTDDYSQHALLTLQSLDEKLQELPMLPSIVTRLLTIDPDSDDYFEALVHLAEQDPPFAARILNMANSASSHPTHKITRLSQAIVRIGSRSIAGMISAMAVLRVFVPSTAGQKYLWVHAIETAICCRSIARHAPHLSHIAEEAYLAGLLHDIGHFIMFDKTPEDLGKLDLSHWHTPAEVIAAEIEVCGFTHADLGWHISQRWGLPEMLGTTIRLHHHYHLEQEKNPELDEETRLLTQIVQLGDMISTIVLRNPELPTWSEDELTEQLQTNCLRKEWHALQINAVTIAGLIESIQHDAHNLIEQLGIFPQGNDFNSFC